MEIQRQLNLFVNSIINVVIVIFLYIKLQLTVH